MIPILGDLEIAAGCDVVVRTDNLVVLDDPRKIIDDFPSPKGVNNLLDRLIRQKVLWSTLL